MHSFDPRSPPRRPPPQGAERFIGPDAQKAGVERGKRAFEHAVDNGYMPLLVGALTVCLLVLVVMIMGDGGAKHARKEDMPDVGHLAEMDDPIARCHLSDDYTVKNGRAVLRYNRRTLREDECRPKAPEGSRVVPAVADCPFLMSIYSGEDVVSNSIRVSGQWEPRISSLVADLPEGSVLLDVGANLGWHTLLALSLGHTVHAFEPLAENVEMLRHSLCLNPGLDARLHLHAAALSDAATSGLGCSIASTLENEGNGQLRCGGGEAQDRGPNQREGRGVLMQRLDTSVPKGTSFDLVKIDVEGHELPVVRGGGDLFAGRGGHVAPRYVVAEFAPAMMREQGFSPDEFLTFFFDRGYTVHYCSDLTVPPSGLRPEPGGDEERERREAERVRGEAAEARRRGGSHQGGGSRRADVRLSRGGVEAFVRDLGMGATTVEMSLRA